jgi:hypothetical protein
VRNITANDSTCAAKQRWLVLGPISSSTGLVATLAQFLFTSLAGMSYGDVLSAVFFGVPLSCAASMQNVWAGTQGIRCLSIMSEALFWLDRA